MKNLIVITQKVDENDDLLGSFIDWLSEFAKYFDKIFVITLAVGSHNLPPNVFIYSLGKESDSSKIIRFFKFYFYLFKLIPQSEGVFAHMSPIFAIASWPAALIFRRRIILWYLHRSVTFKLKLAEKLCFRIVTAARESLNLKSEKITEMGHGINFEKFKPVAVKSASSGKPLDILTVGRISKIKNIETLIRAASLLKKSGLNFSLRIVGRPVMPDDFAYQNFLKRTADELDFYKSIDFVGFVPHAKTAAFYQNADIFINLAPRGGIDKVVIEAVASGCLPLVANEVFKKYFGLYADDLIFQYGSAEDLAEKILRLSEIITSGRSDDVWRCIKSSMTEAHNYKKLVERISKLYV